MCPKPTLFVFPSLTNLCFPDGTLKSQKRLSYFLPASIMETFFFFFFLMRLRKLDHTKCNTPEHTKCNTLEHTKCNTLENTKCNTLENTTCNTLEHTKCKICFFSRANIVRVERFEKTH